MCPRYSFESYPVIALPSQARVDSGVAVASNSPRADHGWRSRSGSDKAVVLATLHVAALTAVPLGAKSGTVVTAKPRSIPIRPDTRVHAAR